MSTAMELYDEATQLKGASRLDEAVAKLREALAIDPNHVLSHSALGVILQRLGDIDGALTHAQKVCELEPNDAFSFTQLSVICQRCGKIPEAEAAIALLDGLLLMRLLGGARTLADLRQLRLDFLQPGPLLPPRKAALRSSSRSSPLSFLAELEWHA